MASAVSAETASPGLLLDEPQQVLDGIFHGGQQADSSDGPQDDLQMNPADEIIADAQIPSADGLIGEGSPSTESPQVDSGDLVEEDTESETEDPILEETEPGEEGLLETEEETEAQKLLAGPIAYSQEAQANLLSASSVSSNLNGQNYIAWNSPINSYLVTENNGYMRVENCSDCILIEHYDSAFVFQSSSTLNRELPIFGGFYCGRDAYYLVFGQRNSDENDNAEVIRVVKYDKNWNRLGAASLCGANTNTPIDFGSLRMTEYGNYLYIHTCHIMYVSPDGVNHQSNLTIQVNTSDFDVAINPYGYCSHSFNQFIIADDAGNIVTLDHGDAYPRTILLGKHLQLASSQTLSPTYGSEGYKNINLLDFRGETGNNSTGASIGGLEYSASSYLTAGNSVPQTENWNPNGVRNIFVTTTSRDNFTAEGSKLTWFTNYPQDGNISASTPHLVKLSNERFLLLWEQMAGGKPNGTLCYLFLDANGNAVGQIYMANGYLSDCKPLTVGNGIVWYVTDGQQLVFYRIDADGSYHVEPAHLHTYEPEMRFAKDVLECGLVEGTTWNALTVKTDGEITYSSSDPAVATVDDSGMVTLNGLGSCTITASASAGVDYRAKSVSYTLNVLDLLKQTISVASSVDCIYGNQVALNAVSSAGGKISYSTSDDKIATVSADGVVTAEGAGTAAIIVQAERTDLYAGAMEKVTVKVQPKDIQGCRLIFKKFGEISVFEYENYIALIDGDRILDAGKDFGWSHMVYYPTSDTTMMCGLDLIVEGKGNYTGSFDVYNFIISPKMTLISVKMGAAGAKLRWKAETGAIGYEIYRKQGDGAYKLIKTISTSDTDSWTDTEALSISGTLSYYIRAYTTDGSKTIYTEASDVKSVVSSPSGDVTPMPDAQGMKLELPKAKYVYTGKTIKPAVTVYYNGKKLAKKNYTVTYKNNKKPGKATVTVKGKDEYEDYSAKLTFTISPKTVGLSSVKSSAKKKVTVKWKKGSEVTGYQIQYSTNSAFKSGNKSKTVSGASKTSVTLTGLKSKKTYYVRVRAYKTSGGKKYYSQWSGKKKVTVK